MSKCEHDFSEVVHCSKCDTEAFYCTKCGEAEVSFKLLRFMAERDYAIKQWVRLENKYEPSRHVIEKPWTEAEMLLEIRSNLAKKEKVKP